MGEPFAVTDPVPLGLAAASSVSSGLVAVAAVLGVCAALARPAFSVSRAVEARSVQARGSLPVTHLERNLCYQKYYLI